MNQVNPYKRSSISTASRERLLLMLYDALIGLVRQAQDAIAKRDNQSTNNALLKAQNIVLELRSTLDKDQAPELCITLYELYTYMYGKLVDANRFKERTHLDDIFPLIQELRDAFAQAERVVIEERANGHAVSDKWR